MAFRIMDSVFGIHRILVVLDSGFFSSGIHRIMVVFKFRIFVLLAFIEYWLLDFWILFFRHSMNIGGFQGLGFWLIKRVGFSWISKDMDNVLDSNSVSELLHENGHV